MDGYANTLLILLLLAKAIELIQAVREDEDDIITKVLDTIHAVISMGGILLVLLWLMSKAVSLL